MRILLVEDVADVAEAIVACTQRMGHDTDWEPNGKCAADRVTADFYDLLILDIMLPDLDGLSLLRRVRDRKISTPVLMLTALGEIEERVQALDMGANDYLVKPFDFRELEARIRALLRQAIGRPTNVLACANLTIDLKSHTAQLDGNALDLTRREVMLLEILVTRPGRIFSKNELIDRLFSIDENPNANTVEQHVARLRKKLTGAHFSIRTLRASVSTTSTMRRRRASAEWRSARRAAKYMSERSRAKRRSTPGRNTLTATSRSPTSSRTRARCTCAIEAAATAGPKLTNTASSGFSKADTIAASASLCGNGGSLSCRLSRSSAIAAPTTSGRVARN